MGETECYAIRSEFQIKGSPHIHSFIRIFNALNVQNVTVYIEFIDETVNFYLLDHLSNQKLCELVKTEFVLNLKTGGNTARENVVSRMVNTLPI